MAGRGPAPRRNLQAVPAPPVDPAEVVVPPIPVCPDVNGWTPRCLRVWEGFWATPHPEEFDKAAHLHLVEKLLLLEMDFDYAEKATTRMSVSKEIRSVQSQLMMTPADLRRAQIAPPKPARERPGPGAPARRRDPRAG